MGGMPPIVKPVQLARLVRARASHVGLAGDRGEAREVDAVGAGHEAQDGLERAAVGRGDEDQRLHDLAELGVDGVRGLAGRVRRLGEHADVEGHALAGRGVDDALDRGRIRGFGHGGEST